MLQVPDATAEAAATDVLPGGTSVTWCHGKRPAWFLAEVAGQGAAKGAGEQHQAQAKAAGSTSAVETSAADTEQLQLSKKQAKACAKATKKLLQAGGGSCKLKQVLSQVQLMLVDAFEADVDVAKALRKRWKQHLQGSASWHVERGVVSVASEA